MAPCCGVGANFGAILLGLSAPCAAVALKSAGTLAQPRPPRQRSTFSIASMFSDKDIEDVPGAREDRARSSASDGTPAPAVAVAAPVAQKEVVQDSCACLNWKKVYAANTVTCGYGMEYMMRMDMPKHWKFGPYNSVTPSNWMDAMQDEWEKAKWFQKHYPTCAVVYQNLDNNMCVKTAWQEGIDVPTEEQVELGKDAPRRFWMESWCYVDASCMSKDAFQVKHKKVAAKLCVPGQHGNKFLGDLSVKELNETVAVPYGIPFDPLYTAAYPRENLDEYENGKEGMKRTLALATFSKPVAARRGNQTDGYAFVKEADQWYWIKSSNGTSVLEPVESSVVSPDLD